MYLWSSSLALGKIFKTTATGDRAVGMATENFYGIIENNKAGPDRDHYEIKAQLEDTSSPVTLFTKSPDHPTKINSFLRKTYGKPHDDHPHISTLHITTKVDTPCFFNGYRFDLNVRDHGLSLEVCETRAFWSWSTLEKAAIDKLSFLDYHKMKKLKQGKFRCTSRQVFEGFRYDEFLRLLKCGAIVVDIRMGAYKDGTPHDHGTAFRVHPKHIPLMYDYTGDCETDLYRPLTLENFVVGS